VVDTPLGRLGIMMANEGSYPENARALAMNGAEVLYRASIPHPAASNDYFGIQNRARALDNNLYILAPNMGTYYLTKDSEAPIDTFGGGSMIVDYRGQIVGSQRYSGVSTWLSGPINIEALRHHRANSPWTNWMKDLRTEMYQMVYEQPIYPKNLYLERPPYTHKEYKTEVTDRQIRTMQERGIWVPPSR
jgi:predicted amidohydrolase